MWGTAEILFETTFFILYINDLLESLTCPALAYADDLKVYIKVSSDLDVQLRQTSISMISNWCAENGLRLSISPGVRITSAYWLPMKLRLAPPAEMFIAYVLCGSWFSQHSTPPFFFSVSPSESLEL